MRLALASFILAVIVGASPAAAVDRVALVIGNGAYSGAARLANPAGDATAIAAALKQLKFDVILATDVDQRGAIAAIDKFSTMMNGASLALLFFAGHGIQISGQNFLLPTDVSVDSERALRYSAIDIQEVVAEMERRADVAIAILDACRDNPFVDQIGGLSRSTVAQRGLGPMRLSGRGAIIAYAAASGDVAADGAGGHSPFTDALLQEIDAPKVEVGLMFRRVARRVIEATHGEQRPELLVRLVDEVYLNPGEPGGEPPVAEVLPAKRREAVVVAKNEGAGQARTAGSERFFGERAVHPPPWAVDIALPKPTGLRAAAPVTIPEAEDNHSYGRAQRVPLAASVQARILPRGDSGWYFVEVPTAGELKVDVPAPPPQIDFVARVWDADHQVIADWQRAERPGGVLAARFPLPRAGGYWIETGDGNNDAESPQVFAVTIDFAAADDPFEPNNSPGAAAPIPIKAEFAPTIYPRGDADWYKVFVPAPGLLSVAATNVPPTLGIAMRISDLNGNVVHDWAVPPRPGGDTELKAEIAAPGVYLIETGDTNNDAAAVDPFRLAVDFLPVADTLEPNNTFGTAAIVPPNGRYDLAIFPRGDADWLGFDVDHPGELRFSATAVPENLDIHMRVWTTDKEVLRDWVGPLRVGGDVDDFVDLPAAGRYFLEIVDGNNDQASEKLFPANLKFTPEPDQAEPNNRPSDATPLTPGGKILFNILPRGDTDWFRVDAASAGELAVTIDESPENLDLNFRIWDSDRKVVRDWVAPYRKGGVTEGFADLPRPGVYFIEVADGNNDERSVQPATLSTVFTPSVDPFEPNDGYGQAAPLSLGEPHQANILPQGDNDWYLIEAPRAGTFVVTVDQVDPALDINVRLWNAEAGVVADWRGPPRPGGVTDAEFTVPVAGLYRLQVADGNNDARSKNPYRIKVDFK
jgi:uncharacterized caspase-like protein